MPTPLKAPLQFVSSGSNSGSFLLGDLT